MRSSVLSSVISVRRQRNYLLSICWAETARIAERSEPETAHAFQVTEPEEPLYGNH